MQTPIRIVIADGHPVFRDAMRQLLSLQKDFAVVAEAGDGDEVLRLVENRPPDILLLSLKMPGTNSFTILQEMQQANNTVTKVILLTASENMSEFLQAIQLGASGIVLKQSPTSILFQRIREVYASKIQADPHTTTAAIRLFSAGEDGAPPIGHEREPSPLSHREREIVALVARGFRNKEIADKILLSEQTVKNHLRNIFEKLGVSDRLDLALYALHKKLCA
jgi:two-component system nitrate/nitrite response regulator NarL